MQILHLCFIRDLPEISEMFYKKKIVLCTIFEEVPTHFKKMKALSRILQHQLFKRCVSQSNFNTYLEPK